jgi:hypothetical protein
VNAADAVSLREDAALIRETLDRYVPGARVDPVHAALDRLLAALEEREAELRQAYGYKPDDHWMTALDRERARAEAAEAALAEARAALGEIAEQQPEVLAIIEKHGFVFDNIGCEPGNWQHLAFTLYSHICEIDLTARSALDVEVGAALAAAGETAPSEPKGEADG